MAVPRGRCRSCAQRPDRGPHARRVDGHQRPPDDLHEVCTLSPSTIRHAVTRRIRPLRPIRAAPVSWVLTASRLLPPLRPHVPLPGPGLLRPARPPAPLRGPRPATAGRRGASATTPGSRRCRRRASSSTCACPTSDRRPGSTSARRPSSTSASRPCSTSASRPCAAHGSHTW